MSSELDLEQELQLELAKLDQIFFSSENDDFTEENTNDAASLATVDTKSRLSNGNSNNYNVFQLAEAEIEKEELQQILNIVQDYATIGK